MVLNFQKRFVPAILAGTKTQTVRLTWKDGRFPFRPGCRLQLYSGMRSKYSQKLADATCTLVERVEITEHGSIIFGPNVLDSATADAFAKLDGFAHSQELVDWFAKTYRHRFPFEGWAVRWRLDRHE